MIPQIPTIDLEPLNEYLGQVSSRGRTMLLPALHEAQRLYGWLPREVLEVISRGLRVPLADIHGVVEFYTMFYNEPMPKRVIRVCEDPACHLAGGEGVAEVIEALVAADERVAFERVPCLGMCELAPVGLAGERPGAHLSEGVAKAFVAGTHPEPKAEVYGTERLLTMRLGKVDPLSLADYKGAEGYDVLRWVMTLAPEKVIEVVESLGILGRGGAMFPLGRKWHFTRGAAGSPAEKHIVANADESEPGTFKDRCLMEEDPFALIEGMTVAGYAVGAENGWIFVRGEYPRSFARLQGAVEAARAAGYLGRDILGRKGFHFDIEVRLGAGAYICGEETALFEAIEGKRGFPRIKPPFPTTHGLFQQPTAINNVETLVAMVAGLRVGPKKWRALGTEGSPGTKLFCVSGEVAKPGLYELPFGATVAELIEMAGGCTEGEVQAVLMGGAAGVFVGPEQLGMPLTYEDAKVANVPLGSGVVMVFGEKADLRQALYQLSRFFAHESCGKCFPCQLGSQRQMEILARVAEGETKEGDRIMLADIGFAMTETSLCGLGQTAASAVLSALDQWPELTK
ncbi:MAG TPA: NAD(P)H-dependent oxidoreductase subunit E [Anaerolineae bacterium]|nr:NAD(P)H-dependent oxidoreductase subunit E [Anaerolineae bacterium]